MYHALHPQTEMFRREQPNVNKLKELRRAAGLTQIQLAERSSVSRWRLCMAETGALELRPSEIEALGQALKPALERAVRMVQEFQQTGV